MKKFLFLLMILTWQNELFCQSATTKDKKWTEDDRKQMEKADLFFMKKITD